MCVNREVRDMDDVRNSGWRRGGWLTLVLALGLGGMPVAGAVGAASAKAEWTEASDEELRALRGGFMLKNGLVLDINMERSVSINGVTQFSGTFHLPDDFSVDTLRQSMVNNGPNNAALADTLANSVSVLRNTLDNQLINNTTVMNINIANLRAMDTPGLQSFIPPVDAALLR
jgi:hypothetical protein